MGRPGLPAFALLMSVALAGCGSEPDNPAELSADAAAAKAPVVATPVPATTANPGVTAELLRFDGHDANGDGYVTGGEYAAAAKKIHRAIDADQNGTITADELDAARAALGLVARPSSEDLIASGDQDNDGKLTLAEWIAQASREIRKIDTDGDERISLAEWNAQPGLRPGSPRQADRAAAPAAGVETR